MRHEGKPPARASNGGAGYAGSHTVVERMIAMAGRPQRGAFPSCGPGSGRREVLSESRKRKIRVSGSMQYFVTPVYWSIPGDDDSRSTGQYFLRLPS
jgi:hypothetical protein